jgi:uncharacterized coiled-coil protein SlyX
MGKVAPEIRGTCLAVVAAVSSWAMPAFADDTDLAAQLKALEAQIADQQKALQDTIAKQQQAIDEQKKKLDELEKKISEQPRVAGAAALAGLRGTGAPGAAGPQVSQNQPQQDQQNEQQQGQQPQQPVGQAPEQERPQVQSLSDLGGVLSRQGHLTLEPTFEYDNSQFNQLFFSGLEVVNTVFIGGLNATNARRNTITAGLNARYGITDFLEANVRVPYVYRNDLVSTSVVNTNLPPTQSVRGLGIGDVEFGLHYQVNRPQNGGAYYVLNMRVKTATGSGPFDIPYDANGLALKDNTGSGFWTAEPSVTWLYPSDPVVLFANVGYAYSFSKTENDNIGGNVFGEVDPGALIRFSGGMGFAINDRVNLNLGYEHDYVQSTVSFVNGQRTESDELQVGALTLGLSYAITPTMSANFSVAAGVTRDAPDVRVLMSLPINLNLFGQ